VGRLRIQLVRHSLCWMLVKMRHFLDFGERFYRILMVRKRHCYISKASLANVFALQPEPGGPHLAHWGWGPRVRPVWTHSSYANVPAKLYIQIASCWPKLSSWVDGILLIIIHPVLIAGPGLDHCGAIFAFCTNSINCTNEKEKLGKHSFSDGKRFTDMFYWFSDHFVWQQKFGNFFCVLVIFCMLI
jgi:hypothetical protein